MYNSKSPLHVLKTPVIALGIASMANAICLSADTLTPTHGLYTETYQSDWSTLELGNDHTMGDRPYNAQNMTATVTNTKHWAEYIPINGIASDAEFKLNGVEIIGWKRGSTEYIGSFPRRVIAGDTILLTGDPQNATENTVTSQDAISIQNLHLLATILDLNGNPASPANYATSLLRIKGIQKVELFDSTFESAHPDNLYNFFIGEQLAELHVSGVSFRGRTHNASLRCEDCGINLIEKSEFEGIVYNGYTDYLAGMAIFLRNNADEGHAPVFSVVQNSYFHDYTQAPGVGVGTDHNDDGINLESVKNALVFNNYFYRWNPDDNQAADATIDVSHRDANISDGIIRIERNIIKDSLHIKNSGGHSANPGGSGTENHIYWTNNLFYNTYFSFYGNYATQVVNNTFFFNTDDDHRTRFINMWNAGAEATLGFKNNLVFSRDDGANTRGINPLVFQNNDLPSGLTSKIGMIESDYNTFYTSISNYVGGALSNDNTSVRNVWQTIYGEDDKNSSFPGPEVVSECFDVDIESVTSPNLVLNSSCSALKAGTYTGVVDSATAGLNSTRDFYGALRCAAQTSTGAAETTDSDCITKEELTSVAAEDGWVKEYLENSNTGYIVNSTDSDTKAIRVGDTASQKQFISILSFDTSAIPSNANIVSATLVLTQASTAGTDPLDSHGDLLIDVTAGHFGSDQYLGTDDFNGVVAHENIASISASVPALATYEIDIPRTALDSLPHASDRVQIRLHMQFDDDDDSVRDLLGLYSGESSYPPKLVLGYENP